ncbi:hypothetical protein FB451DRAFT_1376098 [Mycena latifolia]|nr:hypothetical protein FB451DRAFT_1376098 [Mycena latifolia]
MPPLPLGLLMVATGPFYCLTRAFLLLFCFLRPLVAVPVKSEALKLRDKAPRAPSPAPSGLYWLPHVCVSSKEGTQAAEGIEGAGKQEHIQSWPGVMLTALKSRGLALEQIRTTGACTEADSGSVGPPAPPCSPCTKALTLAHHLALLTVFDDTENSDVCVGGVGGAGGGAGGGREVGGGTPQRRAGPAEKGTWKYCHDLLPSDAYPGLLGGFYSYTDSKTLVPSERGTLCAIDSTDWGTFQNRLCEFRQIMRANESSWTPRASVPVNSGMLA